MARSNSDGFNPYHLWLGIPEAKCPPTFYELLGVSLNEDERAVIKSAADRQRSHVEQFLGTEFNKYANKLISQIDEAEITLLSPELRREYDRKVKLFKKRRKERQIDPNYSPSSISSNSSRSVGEGSGFFREYAGIVAVLTIAFFGMAAASFWLPWGKLQPDQQNANRNIAKQEEPIAKPKPVAKVTAPAKVPEPESKKESINSIGMKFQLIPEGTFLMGATSKTKKDDEKPAHQVILTKPFEMGVYEVTQKQYEKVMGVNPSEFKGQDNPVDGVNWNDAVEFCRKLSETPDEKGFSYRLPTEAEWEYACRAGSTTGYCFGDIDSQLGDYAWYFENSDLKSHPVGEKKPNSFGLYDMHGNVFEWCQDWYDRYQDGVITNPNGPASAKKYRVLRGGGVTNTAIYCSSSARHNFAPDMSHNRIGFRVVRVSSQQATRGANVNANSTSKKSMSETAGQPTPSPTNNSAEKLTNSIGMKLNLIRPGRFKMGSKQRSHNEKPEQLVTVTHQFYIGTTEVTQEQYEQIMGVNRSKFKGPLNPVESVSWEDAKKFCRRLSELPKEKEKGYSYRLPTEIEWEYACRAGSISEYCFGDDATELRDYAWCKINSQGSTHPVGQKLANDWGLYDMHGNVWEWCEDSEGARRVSRGGGWFSVAKGCRSPVRGRDAPTYKSPFMGFRIVLNSSNSSGQ